MELRRKLLKALGAAVLTAPFGSFAQQQNKVWRIGVLHPSSRPDSLESHFLGAFPLGMRELGYVEGKNLVIEYRWAENKAERLPGLAAELVQLKVNVIVATSNAVNAAQKATASIPIVMAGAADPVGDGLIKSLARPGGNITGISNLAGDISSKQLEMLRDMVPKLTRVVVLRNPNSPNNTALINLEAAARRIAVTIIAVDARTPQEIDNAFSQMARQKPDAAFVIRDSFFNRQVRQIAELAAKHRLPTIYGAREYPEAGGLMSYGNSLTAQWRHAATYVDKILKGAKPADLPVEQPTIFELVINGKTAKALGLKIPQSLLIMADKVIE
jgi:putative ABC transport system substrate-binding protein